MGCFWGLILAFEMSANPALLPPGFYASETRTRDRELLIWAPSDVPGSPLADPATVFRTCHDSQSPYNYS